ncbi:unnamed protein product, partial [Arabidopsis halleri]
SICTNGAALFNNGAALFNNGVCFLNQLQRTWKNKLITGLRLMSEVCGSVLSVSMFY